MARPIPKSLMVACSVKDSDTALRLINEGCDVNARSISGNSPLILCLKGFTDDSDRLADVAIMLIQKGADVNARTVEGITPLMITCKKVLANNATWTQKLDLCARLLISNGASTKPLRGIDDAIWNVLMEEKIKLFMKYAWQRQRFNIWRKMAAKRIICCEIMRVTSCPDYAMCRQRLIREYERMVQSR
jgi:hypothetical protein